MSASATECGSLNTTPKGLAAGRSPMMTCFSNVVLSSFVTCLYHARPKSCAARLVMTSFFPSPSTSYTCISAPP